MKQLIRRVIDKKGRIVIEEIPTPNVGGDQILLSTRYSLISSGTELGEISKDPIELAKLTLTDPWMRNAVKSLVFTGGMKETYDTIINELILFRLIGYSGAGTVIAKGKNIRDIEIGEKAAFAAQGHAEQVAAYANHVVKVPDTIDLKHASFVTVGAIAMQGVRRAKCSLGEWVLVYGLGLVGQLAAQILTASGAKVIGIDISESRINLAKSAGLRYTVNPNQEDSVNAVLRITGGKGTDATIICAVSSDPAIANNAMKMTRKQGRVVFVGIVKMDLERKPFFLNELDLSFSRAYGPGSYDNAYEKGRIDYPYHYVRWTERRNLEEVIRLIEEQRLNIEPLIDSVYPLAEAQTAFDIIRAGKMKSAAILLSYAQESEIKTRIDVKGAKARASKDIVNVGVIGVGNFTRNVHVPNLNRIKGFNIRAVASGSGLNAASLPKRFPMEYVTTDYREMLKDPEIDMVIVATRHDLHARFVIEAANAGKHVFVEKPVAMNLEELEAVRKAVSEAGVQFMAGYNRRYSPTARAAKKYVTQLPIVIQYTVNIQHLPDSHWTLDSVEGGGRLVGEADHFFDLMNYYSGSRPIDVQACAFPISEDLKDGLFNFMVQVKFENNSLGHLIYTSLGGPKLPRENIELFCGDKHIQVVDFKKVLVNYKTKFRESGMGHYEELEAFWKQIAGGSPTDDRQLDTLNACWVSLKANELISGA